MKKTLALNLFFACGAILFAAIDACAANVNVSLNLFPTNSGNPSGGGTFTIFAKTDAPLGIAALDLYLSNISQTGLTVENDIASILIGGNPFSTPVTGGLNILYGQNPASGPLVFGVGTAATSDGPDVFGSPAWNGATKIFSGNYSGGVPVFITPGSNSSAANVFVNSGSAPLPPGSVVAAMNFTSVVRLGVPEPATMGGALIALAGLVIAKRRR